MFARLCHLKKTTFRKKQFFPTVIDRKAQFLYDSQVSTDSIQAINIQAWETDTEKWDRKWM